MTVTQHSGPCKAGGPDCVALEKTLAKAKVAAADVKKTQTNFETSVIPMVKKLNGLNQVSTLLLHEANNKTSLVQSFEVELKTKIQYFTHKKGREIAMAMHRMRAQMIKELDELMSSCDKTMTGAKTREGDFKSILVNIKTTNE